jgi:hypothetical protein
LNAEKRDQICGLMVGFCTKTTHRHTKWRGSVSF